MRRRDEIVPGLTSSQNIRWHDWPPQWVREQRKRTNPSFIVWSKETGGNELVQRSVLRYYEEGARAFEHYDPIWSQKLDANDRWNVEQLRHKFVIRERRERERLIEERMVEVRAIREREERLNRVLLNE